MKPYPKYRDSGVEWIGRLPDHWKMTKLKRLAKVKLSNIDKKSNEEDLPVELCNYVDVYYNDRITSVIEFMKATARKDQIDSLSLKQGDVIITKDSETADDIAVSSYVPSSLPGVVCGYHLAHIRPYEGYIYGNYLFRAFASHGICDQFKISANGVTRFGIGKYAIDNSMFLVPPTQEQITIATYLDRKTAQIEDLIAKKSRLLELLTEERAAAINQAVTKGLDPSVKMKDSGMEWVGEVPEHWDIVEFRRIIERIEQGWSPVAENRLAADDEWAVIKVSAVGKGKFRETEHKALKDDTTPISCLEIRSGDILLTRANTPELVGDACIVKEVRNKLMLSDLVYRLNVEPKRIYSCYFVYLLICRTGRVQIEMDARGTSQSMVKISQEKIKSWRIMLPSLHEQVRIAEYLDQRTAQIDQTITKAEKQIQLLQEYRTALISDVVTGKIDVREERAA